MAVRTISTKLAVDGEAQFKQAITACNSQLALLKSSLAATESEFRNNANSLDALRAKDEKLNELKEAQAQKVQKLREALENCRTAVSKYTEQQAELESKVKASGDALSALDSASQKAGKQWAGYAQEIEKSEKALEDLKKKSGDTSAEQAKLEASIAKAREEMAKLESSTDGAAKQAGELILENKKLNEAFSDNAAKLDAAARGANNWEKQLNTATIEANKLDDELAQNSQYLKEAESSADNCAKSIDQYGKAVKDAGEASEDFGGKSSEAIEQLAQVLAAAGIAKGVQEIAQALLECSDAAEAFQTSIAKVSTIADTSVMSIEDIQAKILTLSSETGKSSAAIAEAVYQAISAGVETSKAVEFVAQSSRLASGGFTETETAVDVLTTALNAYKMSVDETGQISDILITTQNLGKTSVDELAKSVGGVIPLAAAYNVQMDNLGTSYAILTANGTATAEAGTKLKAMLRELGDSGSTVAGVLREQTGKSFAELTAGGMSLGDVLAVLGDSVGGSATAFNELWSSSEAGVGALSLFNSGADKFNAVLSEMQSSAGATTEAYGKMADTTEFTHQRMTTATENLKIAIGSQLNPALENLYDTGADAFSWATDFVNEHPAVVKAAAALVVGLTALTAGVTTVTVATAAMNAVLAANPIGLLAAGAVAAVAAVGAFAASLGSADGDTKEFTKSLNESRIAYDELTSTMTAGRASTTATASALLELLAVEERSALQKDLLAGKVAELNEAIPNLGLAYDAATDSINMEADAIERLVEKAAEQEEYEAQVARLSELHTEQAEILSRLEAARATLNEAENTGVSNTRMLRNNIEDLTAAQEENAAQIAELEAASSAYAEKQAEAAAKTSEMTARIESITSELETLQVAYDQSMQKANESIGRQIGLFKEMDGSAKTSVDNLIETLKGQVAYMETYSQNIQKAMEMGVDQGLIKKLSDGSEESAQILAAIVQGGEEDIAALNEELAKVEEGKENFSKTVAEMETDFNKQMDQLVEDLDKAIQDMNVREDAYKIGINNMQGLINGTASQKQALVQKYTEMGNAALAAYKKAVQQQSPSKAFYRAGSFDIQGIIKGAESEKGNLDTAYADIARTALDAVDEAMRGAEPPDYTPEVDYSALMLEAKSLNEFLELASRRTAKIIGENIDVAASGLQTNAQLLEQWKQSVGLTAQDIESMAHSIQYDPDVDYSALMLAAKDLEEFLELSSQRTAKILNENILTTENSYETNAQLLEKWLSAVELSAERFERAVDGVTYRPEVDYSALMLQAESLEEFEKLAAQRSAKIVGENIDMVAQGYASNEQLLEQWAGTVQGSSSTVVESVREMEAEFTRKMESLKESMCFTEDAYQIGADNIRSFIDGAASMQDELVAQYADMGKAAAAAYEQEIQQGKLAAAYTDAAQNAMEKMERFLPSTQLAFRPLGQERQTDAIVTALSKLDFGNSGGGQSGISAADLASAVREALSGASVQLDGRRVGKFITDQQNNDDKSWGR